MAYRNATVIGLILSSILISSTAEAQTQREHYSSVAKSLSGEIVYKESHEALFSTPSKIKEAKTLYLFPDGRKMAELKSNFEKLVTAPEYEFTDFRDNSSHGLELRDDAFVLWKKDAGKPREEKSFPKKKFDTDTLVVGCQGLHYYLITNLESVKERKTIPVKYLIPGKLDYFSFTLKYEGENEDTVHLSLKIDSLFLRIFTSSLNLKYSKKDRRLLEYSGLSNIPGPTGELQNVTIAYDYTPP